MKQPLSLKYFAVIFTLLGLLLYSSLHFAAAQQEESDLDFHSQIKSQAEAAALPPTLFLPAQSFALVEQPDAQAVGIGDFNHDGRADVAVTSGTGSQNFLYVFLQGANRRLQQPEPYPADVRPEALAVGDLNGDGRDDIAVASAFDNQVSVYLQTADGKLADRKQYAAQQGPDAIAVADVNQDGLDDVIVSHWNHPSVGVLIQQTDGTLADMLLYAVPQAGRDDIDIGDVNGDGLPDVVKMNGQGTSPDLSVLLQTTSATLELPISYHLSGDSYKSGLAVGDLTGDGKADVVVTHYGDATDPSRYKVSLFKQQQDGSLLLVQSLLADTRMQPIEIADVNGDGRNDAITAGETHMQVYQQLSDGTLAPYQEYQMPYASYLHPQALDVGDINSDGLPDVVIAANGPGLVVLYHVAPTTPTPTSTPAPTLSMTNTPTTPSAGTPTTFATPTVTETPSDSTTPTTPTSEALYLPLISRSSVLIATPTAPPTPTETATPTAGYVAFSATTACENEAATWEYSPVTYAYGKRLLATTFTFVNHIGQNWRLEWHYNGQSRPALDQSGIVTKSPEPITVEIFYGATGACQLPLPSGVYVVRIFLDNVLWKEGTATIQ